MTRRDTPRTDAAVLTQQQVNDGRPGGVVDADYARQLERELLDREKPIKVEIVNRPLPRVW